MKNRKSNLGLGRRTNPHLLAAAGCWLLLPLAAECTRPTHSRGYPRATPDKHFKLSQHVSRVVVGLRVQPLARLHKHTHTNTRQQPLERSSYFLVCTNINKKYKILCAGVAHANEPRLGIAFIRYQNGLRRRDWGRTCICSAVFFFYYALC